MSHLLATKLHRPSLPPKWVQRPRIGERLTAGLDAGRRITLVSAPAGFGKTICVCDWLGTLVAWPIAWLSLDAADDDPGRFFTYFVAALRKVDAGLGEEIEGVLRAGNLPSSEIISSTLVDDILALGERFLFVFDDFHVIQDGFILQVLETLIANLPEALYLVLLTREDPPLHLARLRANNQLTEIRTADLRFTPSEVEDYLNGVMGFSLSPEDISLLAERTEGWIAGLHLAGLSMRDRKDVANFIATLDGSHRFILSYLTEEVLNRQPEEIKRFLLETSILDRLNGDLCNAVTGRSDGHETLERLLQANLFLIPLDDEGQWYRYHQLFADLLRDRFVALSNGDTAALHRRASQWYGLRGMISDAIHHALAGEDYGTAVGWIEAHAMDMLMQWHVKTVDGWMHAIPAEWIAQSPQANLAFAWLYLMRANPSLAFPYLERLGTMFADPEQGAEITREDATLEAKWLALQAMLLNAQGQQEESLRLCQRALEIVSRGDPSTSTRSDVQVRSMIYLGLANAHQQLDDYENAVEAFQDLIQLGQAAGNSVSELLGISGMALLAIQHGHYQFAFDAVTQGIERIERSGSLPPISTAMYGELAVIHYQRHQLELAHHYFQRSIQVSALSGYSDAELFYGVILSRLYQIQGDLKTAAEKIRKAMALMQIEAPAAVREEVLAQQVRIHLELGDLDAAERVLEDQGFSFRGKQLFPGLDAAPGPPRFAKGKLPQSVWVLYISALRVLLHRVQLERDKQNLDLGIELANHLIGNALEKGYVPFALETLLVRAQLHNALGNSQDSHADYLHALRLGEPEGLISIFLEEGTPVAEAMERLLEGNDLGDVHPGYVEKILEAFPEDGLPEAESAAGDDVSVDEIIEPLSKRELEILTLIDAGCSNQQIAERLVVTLHTVKKHCSNIYAKLGVKSRTQAVARARRLKLL